MVKSVDSSALQEACSWACWTLQHTDMPKPKVFRSAANKFAVPMAAVERAVKASMGGVAARAGEANGHEIRSGDSWKVIVADRG